MYTETQIAKAADILEKARTLGLKIATAESCTGGLIAGLLTEIAGSSSVVDRGFVTYSNSAKIEMLGVSEELIGTYGAVSEPVAIDMAEGAWEHAGAELTISVTGIAGPGGGSPEKPVGLVHIASAREGFETAHQECRFGDLGREQVRSATIDAALDLLLCQLDLS